MKKNKNFKKINITTIFLTIFLLLFFFLNTVKAQVACEPSMENSNCPQEGVCINCPEGAPSHCGTLNGYFCIQDPSSCSLWQPYNYTIGRCGDISCSYGSTSCPSGSVCNATANLSSGVCIDETTHTPEPGILTGNCQDNNDCRSGFECVFVSMTEGKMCSPKKIKPKKTLDLNPLGELNVKIPGLDEMAAKYPIICDEDGKSCKIPWIALYIHAIYNYLLGIGGVLAAIALMIGGVLWLISAGNASRVSQAKSWITGSLTGLIILLTSYVLLYEINPELLGMKYIQMENIESHVLPIEAQILAPTAGPSSHGVTLYYQCSTEGKSIFYNHKNGTCSGAPTLCTSGCGILSTFMAVNKYVAENNLEQFTRNGEDLGTRYVSGANDCNGSIYTGLIELAKSYGLSAASLGAGSTGKNGIIQKLDEGCIIVAGLSGGGECRFTSGGHYIVLTGWREKNNLIVDVNDPAGNGPYPNKGECKNNPTTCKTWLSLNDFGNCNLQNSFYVCAP